MEMHTGEPLFDGRNEGDQLRKIVEIMGCACCRALPSALRPTRALSPVVSVERATRVIIRCRMSRREQPWSQLLSAM